MPKRAALCGCGHHQSAHNEARRGIPAYCARCTGARALHGFKEARNATT